MKTFTSVSVTAAVLVLGSATGCASTAPSGKDAQIPPTQLFDARIQPARVPPNPQGAFALSTATGCDVIYIAKTPAVDTVTYAVRPTSRMPDLAQCVDSLRGQPGVESVTARS